MENRGKKYEKPEVEIHGNLTEITKGNPGVNDDGEMGEGSSV